MHLPDLRLRRWWAALGWLGVATVLYLSLTPDPPVPDLGWLSWDKAQHFLAYACLMGWFAQLYHGTTARLAYAIFLIAMGVALEFIQGIGSTRQFEYEDMLANTLGVAAAFVLTLGSLRYILHRLEARLFRAS